jgi:hypothetical protein
MQNLINQSTTTAVALPVDDPWLEVANEGGGRFGKLIKFAKGEWTHKDDQVAVGTEFVVHMAQAMRGWVRFEGGRPVDYKLGLIREGAKFADRTSLGFMDKTGWERDKRGDPVDPWCQQHYIPMLHLESGELYTWVFSSYGGKQAFRDLARVYSPYRKTSSLPVVSLQTASYRHETFGKIDVPVLKVERFDDPDSAPPVPSSGPAPSSGPTRANADMNDAIPFAAEFR